MKKEICIALLVCGLILAIPTVITSVVGPEDREQLTLIAFLFYPLCAISLYMSCMYAFWAGARVQGEEIILRKMGIIPITVIVQRYAVRNIQVKQRIAESSPGARFRLGPYTMNTVVLWLRNGKKVRTGELPELKPDVIRVLRSATSFYVNEGTKDKRVRDVRYTIAMIPMMIQLIMIAGGYALYMHLNGLLVP